MQEKNTEELMSVLKRTSSEEIGQVLCEEKQNLFCGTEPFYNYIRDVLKHNQLTQQQVFPPSWIFRAVWLWLVVRRKAHQSARLYFAHLFCGAVLAGTNTAHFAAVRHEYAVCPHSARCGVSCCAESENI